MFWIVKYIAGESFLELMEIDYCTFNAQLFTKMITFISLSCQFDFLKHLNVGVDDKISFLLFSKSDRFLI